MPRRSPDKALRPTAVRGIRSAVGRESTTFGFSILVTVTFGIMQVTHGTPDIPRLILYAVGAVMSFTILEGVLSGGFRRPMPQHHTRTLTLGTSANVVSVCLGLLAAWGAAEMFTGLWVWALASFVGATVYLLLEGLETAIAERVLSARGYGDADDMVP